MNSPVSAKKLHEQAEPKVELQLWPPLAQPANDRADTPTPSEPPVTRERPTKPSAPEEAPSKTRLSVEQMRALDIFRNIPDKALDWMRPHIAVRQLEPGEVILREGDFGNSAFYVLDGNVRVFLEPLDLSQLGRHQIKKRSIWKRLKSLFRKNPRGHAFIVPTDAEGHSGGFSREGVLYDDEGKTIHPHFLPNPPLNKQGQPIDASRIMVLGPGEIFGEMAALFRASRWATITADTETATRVLEIKVQALRLLTKRNAEFKATINDRFRDGYLPTLLTDSGLFEGCDPNLLERIIETAEFNSHKPNETILNESQGGSRFTLISAGNVRLSHRLEGNELNFDTLKKGDFFGEYLLLPSQRESYSAVALNTVQTISIHAGLFAELMNIEPVRNRILNASDQRQNMLTNIENHVSDLAMLNFGIENGLIDGQSIMVIDAQKCTRCDDCVQACADAHDGYPRFAREGKSFGGFVFPHACMQCADPLCMDGCPSGALHRSEAGGDVLINLDACVGCHVCVINCIYDNIVPLPIAETLTSTGDVEAFRTNPLHGKPDFKAMKCDSCVETGDPACVRSCSQNAIQRLSFKEIVHAAANNGGHRETTGPSTHQPLQ